ncbi:MAG: hypothetical protein M3P16_00245 [Chloroflexota bacterium]|nr:hypothetical protein [Chloroflexota bacterium]
MSLPVALAISACVSAGPVIVPSPRPASPSPIASVTVGPTPSPAPTTAAAGLVSAGAAPEAGVLFIQGPDNRIYRYDGATGALAAISGAATFAGERADGAVVVGTHGSADLLRWDGSVGTAICGDRTVIAVAADGACAFTGEGGDASVYVQLPREATRRKLLPADWGAGGLVWDPDGTRIALMRSLAGPDLATRSHNALWLIDADGTPRELYRPPGASAFVYSLGWSPDGRSIAALQQGIVSASAEMDGAELLLVDVSSRQVTSLGTIVQHWYRWSDDSRLAFVRGGGRETWIGKQLLLRERDGAIVPVSAPDRVGLAPAWAPSGGRLAWIDAPQGDGLTNGAYVNGVGPGARRASVSTDRVIGSIDCGDRVVEGVRWSADDQLLLLCRRPGDVARPLELWLRRFATAGSPLFPLVTGLGDDTLRGFGVYGAHPSLFSLVAWSKAVPEARPALRPTGFLLPSSCAYLNAGTPSGERTLWGVDCGVAGRHDARGLLGAALTAQGWVSCGPALANGTWLKDQWALTVGEPSGEPLSYIGLTESPRRIVSC